MKKLPELAHYERRVVRLRAQQDLVLLLLDKRHKVGLMSWWTPRRKRRGRMQPKWSEQTPLPSASHVSGKGLVLTCQVDWCKAG